MKGCKTLAGGSILGGLILGAIAVCIIDRNFVKAGGFALAGSIMTFFGFMHGEKIGINVSPVVALSYLLVAGIAFGCAKGILIKAPEPLSLLLDEEHMGLEAATD